MSPVNRQRGETRIVLGGKDYKLLLTLGAMAELEEALGIESLTQIGDVMKMARTKDLIVLLTALLHGGGHKDLTQEAVADFPLDLKATMVSIQETFKAAGFGDEDDEAEVAANSGK